MPDEPKKPVESLARKGEGVMDKEEFAAVVKFALAESVAFVDTELSTDRAKATEYYFGKPLGNEEEGRSQVVLTEVRDAVDGMLPSLLRVFFGAEHTVEFVPTRAETVAQAEQMTDYVRYVFEEDNSGFLHTLAVLKDGMVRKIGIFKWGWDESGDAKAYKQEGLAKPDLDALVGMDDVEPSRITPTGDTYSIEFTRKAASGRARVWSVPPEEFFYNRQARSLDEALLVGHRTEKTRGQLLAMGVTKKDIEAHGGAGEGDTNLNTNDEEIARRDISRVGAVMGSGFVRDPEMGKANDKVPYCEAYMTVDYDGDGIAELRRICTIGASYFPVSNDPCDERPFSVFTPYPEPHALLGGSVADRTMDMQRINSAILRAILDSASISAFPRTVYVEGQANVNDIMNTAIGAPIRERVAGAVRNLEQSFTGKELLPVLMFGQEIIERRTGRNKGAAGLDADALQSTDKGAVEAVLNGSQEQIEVIARVFAELTLKPLFKGLGRLLNTKQPKSRMVRLRGQWVDVDPRSWTANMDVTVNVGLGTTFTEKKIEALMAVAADQKDIASVLGLSNPIVGLGRIRNTRAKILELRGIKNVDDYYAPLPIDYQPPPAPATPPDPEQQWIQLEGEMNHTKTMKELAIKQDDNKLKADDQQFRHSMEWQKFLADIELKKYAIDAQFRTDLNAHALDADKSAVEHALAITEATHTQDLELAQHDHATEMDTRAADTADTQVEQAAKAPE